MTTIQDKNEQVNENTAAQFIENELNENESNKTSKFFLVKGYFYGSLFTIFSCLYIIFVKIAPTYNSFDHAIIRYIIQFLSMVYFLQRNHLSWLGPESKRMTLFLRGISGSGAILFGLISLRYLAPSDVETLINSSVLITAILGHFFLKEKITIIHLISVLMTTIGIIFIIRPEFLYGIENFFIDAHIERGNSTELFNHQPKRDFIETAIGVSFVILSAFFQSLMHITTRKLCIDKLHFSVISIYPVYVGLPISLISLIGYSLVYSHYQVTYIPSEFFYAICGGVMATISIIFLNKALEYEEAAKIVILRTTGIFFTYIFQYFILELETDILGIIGAVLIISGTIVIMITKIKYISLLSSK